MKLKPIHYLILAHIMFLNDKTKSADHAVIGKTVNYYNSYNKAKSIHDSILKSYHNAKIWRYGKGFAIQYYASGPYYPELQPIDET